MRIVVCGLGHLGRVTIACLCRDGHGVAGVDTNDVTHDLVACGFPPIHQPAAADLIAAARVSVATGTG